MSDRPLVRWVCALLFAALLTGCGRQADREAAPAAAPARPSTDPGGSDRPTTARSGEQVYQELCALCHMADGSGVPNMQPSLINNPIVTGDPAKLEAVIRAGSAALRDREPQYAAEMPPFGTLSSDEVKAVMAYVRERFGGAAVETKP
jgi:mono/diheme cytochrome c family protein